MARAFELVLTPLLFALAGRLLDRWLGTGAVFTAGLAAFALAGVAARMYYGYVAAMEEHAKGAPWASR